MSIACIIPARYASSRFPGKPLANIAGSPMVEWVYRRAMQVSTFNTVIVATDDDRIMNTVTNFGGLALLTPDNLPSGTDRVAFIARDLDADVVVNLQGDEPLIDPGVLVSLCEVFDDPVVQMATPISKITTVDELTEPNKARVVIDQNFDALYFTRAAIPYCRDAQTISDWLRSGTFYKHVGIYAYRNKFLQTLTSLPQGALEKIEKLEQLRVLENGYKIRTVLTDYNMHSVDTKEELEQLNKFVRLNDLRVDTHYAQV